MACPNRQPMASLRLEHCVSCQGVHCSIQSAPCSHAHQVVVPAVPNLGRCFVITSISAGSLSASRSSRVAVFLTLALSTAFGQLDTGLIVGTVRDASGGAIARATVTATNAATSQTL